MDVEEQICGFLCLHKRECLVAFCLVLPLLIVFVYILFTLCGKYSKSIEGKLQVVLKSDDSKFNPELSNSKEAAILAP